jgi:DMSO/TMAO reductase YedYZ molybdopterin-dependent catalytic subunit
MTKARFFVRRPWMIAAMLVALTLAAAAATADEPQIVIDGLVKRSLHLDARALRDLPATEADVAFKGGGGEEKAKFTGVLLWNLLAGAGGVDDPAKRGDLRHVMTITGRDGYTILLSLGEIDPDFGAKPAMIAYLRNGEALPAKDGLRLIVPGDRHGGRDVRDVVHIEVK